MSVTGQWKQAPPGTKQSHELHAEAVQVLGENEADVSLLLRSLPIPMQNQHPNKVSLRRTRYKKSSIHQTFFVQYRI